VTASRLSRLVGVLFAAVVAVFVTACSAGQHTQTASQVAAVPGVSVNLGPDGDLALRDLTVAYHDSEGYPQGGSAPLVVRIFNDGPEPAVLVGVSSTDATSVSLVGGAPAPTPVATPPASPTAAATPTAEATATPGAEATSGATPVVTSAAPPTPTATPTAAGQTSFRIEIPAGSYVLLVPDQGPYLQLDGLTRALTPGSSVPVTFTFEGLAPATVTVPSGLPTAPAPRGSVEIAEHE
jgi:copper(I)-binding protein